MNHDPRFPLPDDPPEREWRAQERALADERAGVPPNTGEPGLRSYRLMAHLLAKPLDEQLPPDFARSVARRVQRSARPGDARFERNLLALLAVAMGVAAVSAVASYGTAWLPTIGLGGAGALAAKPWAWVLAACLGLSRLSRPWLQHDRAA